ncbi:hypothetical protein ABC977_13935 [Thioalkalicoccus limnaeus]|uniref:Uncharacterized protein n=1 Tax=Thioalkalicoccus limnaeus TaxID=120681 RepID=A0ABV4BG45_9GAMM
MKRLIAQLKKALAALAYADVGEMLPGIDKDRVLGMSVKPVPATPTATSMLLRQAATVTPLPGLRQQVGLYLGATLDPAVIRYAADTCREIQSTLTLVTFQSEDTVRELLAPHLPELEGAGVPWRIARLQGEPHSSLVRYLRQERRMLFLACSDAGFFGHEVRGGGRRRMDFGLPIVIVRAEGTALPLGRTRLVSRG